MLESPDDDTGRDSLFLRESTYARLTIVVGDDESKPRVARHKRLRRPGVCLVFEPIPVSVGTVDEHVLLAVEKQVRRLVEQAEPQVIVRLVARAQRNDRPAGREPPCGARSRASSATA